MDPDDCPPWYVMMSLARMMPMFCGISNVRTNSAMFTFNARIDPGNAFRLDLKVAKYTADVEYTLVEMAEQEHVLWLDRTNEYSLAQFYDDVATKII